MALRPIFHQLERRIEAHIFVAFMAYCLHVTLRARLRPFAPGLLTPRAVLDKFAAIQMLDVHFPTTDGRTLILSRYTHPEPEQRILLEHLDLPSRIFLRAPAEFTRQASESLRSLQRSAAAPGLGSARRR